MFITQHDLICFEQKLDDKILKLIVEARNSLGDYCINTCKSLCCKRGCLVLFNNYEIEMIALGNIEEYFENGVLKATSSGNILYDLTRVPCKNLGDDFMCKVWKEKNRPVVCQDFPIFVKDNFVITGDMCPAIKEGLLDKYIAQFKEFGLKII